jgi:hypothetical protein
LGLGLALGAFLKCLVNPVFADEVKELALVRKKSLGQSELEVVNKTAPEKPKLQEEKQVPVEASLTDYELGAIQILSELQKEGRLVDFLEENLSDYEDDEIGSSVRSIHEGCKKVMDKVLEKEKLVDQEEESSIRVNKDYNATQIKLSGRVSETFPQKGILVHPGWKAKNLKLSVRPKASSDILCPAEIEID